MPVDVEGSLSFWFVDPIVKFYFVLGFKVSFYLLFDFDFPFSFNYELFVFILEKFYDCLRFFLLFYLTNPYFIFDENWFVYLDVPFMIFYALFINILSSIF